MTNRDKSAAWESVVEADRIFRRELMKEVRRRNNARAYSARVAERRRVDRLVRRLLVVSIVIFLVVSVLPILFGQLRLCHVNH